MELEGNIKQFPLAELVHMIVYSSVTGALEIGQGGTLGRIYSRDGRIYHASAGDATGVEAFCRLFEQTEAPFRFVAGVEAGIETLWQDPWELVVYAERRVEAWRHVRAFIPSLDCLPMLRSVPSEPRVQVSDTGWTVLARVDGEHSINEIADAMGHVPLEVAEALVPLIQQGMVAILPPRDAPRPPPPPAGLRHHLPSTATTQHIPNAEPDTPIWRRLRSRG